MRNGFGMAFDPESGNLWDAQNGDDSFSELNRVEAGSNLGWVQVMGPISRIEQFKAIETTRVREGDSVLTVCPGNAGSHRGRGLPLMRALMDAVDVDHGEDGTVVVLERALRPRSAA